MVGIGAKLGVGSGVTAGWVGGGELGHHEVPCGGPGGTDGGDEELGWEGRAPEEFGDAGKEVGVRVLQWWLLVVEGNYRAAVKLSRFEVFGSLVS